VADGVTAVVSGCIGPRGDGYDPANVMTPEEAERYHAVQIGTLAATTADQVTAMTLSDVNEAIGIVRAAAASGIPAAISFTVETDGRLPAGQPLHEAIEQVDAETDARAAYFMVNCAHPIHFADALRPNGAWKRRLIGLRANASMKSHAELDNATELDEGDPLDLGARHAALRDRLSAVTVLGGCCGTDARHVAAIVSAWRGD
jgi:homocysteine S-methyltransferase